MTTPLGTSRSLEREGRRVRVARRTRETDITIDARPRRLGPGRHREPGSASTTTCWARSPTTACSTSRSAATGDLQVDEHHTVEDVALVLGAAFAEALGDRAGIRRFGDSSVPMDESVATAVIDVGGRPYAVIDLPFRAERAGTLPLQLVDHALESFARTAGATLHLRGTGRNDHHLAEAAFKALGPGAAGRLRAGSAAHRASPRPRGRSGDAWRPTRRAWSSSTTAPATSCRSSRRSRPPGRRVSRAVTGDDIGDAGRRWSSRASAPPLRRWTGFASGGFIEPIRAWIDGRSPVPGHLPRPPAAVRGQRRGRRRDPRDPARPHRPPRWRPDAPAHRLEPGRSADATHPAFAGIADGADFYFVHSYVGQRRTAPSRR